MKVICEFQQIVLQNERGTDIDSVRAVCSRCEHETESYGTGDASIKRCLALMNEECPEDEDNYYVNADES